MSVLNCQYSKFQLGHLVWRREKEVHLSGLLKNWLQRRTRMPQFHQVLSVECCLECFILNQMLGLNVWTCWMLNYLLNVRHQCENYLLSDELLVVECFFFNFSPCWNSHLEFQTAPERFSQAWVIFSTVPGAQVKFPSAWRLRRGSTVFSSG
jgi:hypothetical protein